MTMRRVVSRAARWLDVSVPLRTGMVHWPGDPGIRVERVKELSRGDDCTLSALSMGAHSGTHMDAPSHFLRGAPDLDSLSIEATVGRARVLAIRNPKEITAGELRQNRIRRGERLLFKTRNSARCWKSGAFVKDFVYISAAAARLLAEREAAFVGIDYLSVGGFYRDGRETHEILLRAGIWIVEGLDLSRVRPGPVDFVCLPIRIAEGEGAPARAILRERPRRKRPAAPLRAGSGPLRSRNA
jgi:arylformamidase